MDVRQFYQLRVTECSADAKRADLTKVRDRALRSQAAWQLLLDRADRVQVTAEVNAQTRPDREA